jgi:hypothetical protein
MRKTRFTFAVIALAIGAVSSSAVALAEGQPTLDDKLAFLEPLLAHDWTGAFVGDDAPDLVIKMHWEAMVDGKAVRYTRIADAVDFHAETFFYVDPQADLVSYFGFDSKGNVTGGTVEARGDSVVITGTSHRPDRTVEYENVFVILPDGRVRDIFTPLNLDPGARGHVQEFEPVKPSE